MGAGRCRARPARAVAAGRFRRRHRALLHRRARAFDLGRSGAGFGLRRRRHPAAQSARRLSAGARLHRRCSGLCRGNATQRDHRASGPAGAGDAEHQRLGRSARGTRAQRPHRGARPSRRRRAAFGNAGTRSRRRAQGHRAAGRRLRGNARTAVAAAHAVAAGRLRLRPRSIFPEDRRLRLCAWTDQDRRTARRNKHCGCATPRRSTPCATPSTNASVPWCRATKARLPRR